MEFRLLSLWFFLYLALVGSNAFEKVDWESYWHSVMPNTQFPKVLSNALLPATSIEDKDATIGKDALVLPNQYRNAYPQGALGLSKDGIKLYTHAFPKDGVKTYAHAFHKDAFGFPKDRTNYGVRKQHTQASLQDVKGYDQEDLFFLEKDLQAGKKLKQRFEEPVYKAEFIPRKEADTIPFSSKKLPEILKRFAIEPRSVEAEIVEHTIEECEEPAIEGESKFCATSPESLIDFSVSKLGKKLQVFTTKVDDNNSKEATKLKEYTITKGVKNIGDNAVVCHRRNYMYAVFYCHKIEATSAYIVSLKGTDRTRLNAVALCHRDTRHWNPQHFVFQILKVKPGTVPVCHFVARDSLVWVPN